MKKGEKAKLDHKWWSKNKSKTLPKTGLGDALAVYQARVDKFRWDDATKALADVQKCAAVGVKKGNRVLHKETIEVLKQFPALVKKEQSRLADKAQEDQAQAAAPKQRKKGPLVFWKKELGREFAKKYGSGHSWLKTMKGGEFRLALNEDAIDVLETEGAQVLVMRMVDECNKIFDDVLRELDTALTGAAKKTTDEGLLTAFVPKAVQRMESKYSRVFQKVPDAIWSKFVAKKKQYKDYKIDTGFDIAITGLKVVGSGLAIAAAVPTGGATLALGVYGGVQSVSGAAKVARDACQEAETVLKRLNKNLNVLLKDWQDTEKKAAAVAKSTGRVIADTILAYPVLPTVSSCQDDFKLVDNKIAGLDVKHVDLGKKVGKVLGELDKLDRALGKADKKVVAKAMKQITKVRGGMTKVLDQTSAMGKRVGDAEKVLKALKVLMTELKKGVPGYVKTFEKVFPVVHNAALGIANAGLGFSAAANALDYANTGLGVANDLMSEVKSQLA